MFKEELTPIVHKHFHKNQKPYLDIKPDKDITRKTLHIKSKKTSNDKTLNLSPLIMMLAMVFHKFFRPKKFPSIPSFVECFIIRRFFGFYM